VIRALRAGNWYSLLFYDGFEDLPEPVESRTSLPEVERFVTGGIHVIVPKHKISTYLIPQAEALFAEAA